MADVYIYGTIKTMAEDEKSAYASQIWDATQNKFQSVINADNSITQEEFDAIFT